MSAEETTRVHVRRDLAAFHVTGEDRLTWLNGLVTQEVGKLALGGGAYALAVGKTGKILVELWVLAARDHAVVVAARSHLEALREHLEKHLIMEDAEMGPVLDGEVVFAHGPRAAELAEKARAQGADAASIDYTGHGAAVIVRSTPPLDLGVPALDDAGWEAQRVAWGVPAQGIDYADVMPQEASLERRAVSFAKGCYLGQEAVFMLEKRGQSRRRLVRLSIAGAGDAVTTGAPVSLADGVEIGNVTSLTPTPDGFAAIALLKAKHAEPGTAVVAGGHAAIVLGLAGG